MGTVRPPLLYIAHDDAVVIVSVLPLKISGGRADVYRWGSVVEMSPASPTTAAWNAQQVRGLGVPCVLAALAFNCFGSRWWPVFAVPGVMLLIASIFVGPRRKRASAVAPDFDRRRDAHRLLTAAEDRKSLSDAIDIAGRICAAWPALEAMIDMPSVERSLAQAIFELAGILEQRQRLRETRDELRVQSRAGLSADNPAVRALMAQLERADRAMAQIDAEFDRRTTALDRAASAGEAFVSEAKLSRVTREADRVLAELTAADPSPWPDQGVRLTHEIEAVLAAYRELIGGAEDTE